MDSPQTRRARRQRAQRNADNALVGVFAVFIIPALYGLMQWVAFMVTAH